MNDNDDKTLERFFKNRPLLKFLGIKMKKGLSSMDLFYLLKEFSILLNCRLTKVYNTPNNGFDFHFHSGKGKNILRVIIPNFIFISKHKAEYPEKPSGFCLSLRKHMEGLILKKIEQKNFERIVELLFEGRGKKKIIIVELFSKGNIILCSGDYEIVNVLETQIWKERALKKNETYNYPKQNFNFLEINENKLSNLIENSDKENLVKILAIDLGLGGVFAEEICLLSKIDKGRKKDITEKEISSLMNAINEMINKEMKANIVYKDNEIININPFEIEGYKDFRKEYSDSFNRLIDENIRNILKIEKKSPYKKKIEEMENIIKNQKSKIEEMGGKIKENQDKAELIYTNYNLIDNILSSVKEEMRRKSLKEIKEKLKGHKLIKELIEKDKKIIIEIQ